MSFDTSTSVDLRTAAGGNLAAAPAEGAEGALPPPRLPDPLGGGVGEVGGNPLASVATAHVGGMDIACLSRAKVAELFRRIVEAPSPSAPLYFTSANGQVLSEYARHPEMRSLFDSADLINADGQALVIASRLLGRRALPERVATTDLYHDVSAVVPRGTRYFLLGATAEEVGRAAAATMRLYPHLNLVGCRDGYFKHEDEAQVVEEIARAAPDVLWICMGVPREQAFVMRHRQALAPVKVIKTGGGLFNFLSGSRRRAPKLLQRAGLEWAWRTMLEPRRLFWRYLITNAHSLILLTLRTR